MHGAISFELILLGAGILLLLSVGATKLSVTFGIPALVLFIGIGMLAGSDGIGGIAFENYNLAREVGTIALALILFAGGMESHWRSIKPVLWQGLSLATVGVGITAGIIGFASIYLLHLPPLAALLLGAIVSSTDAAAVFGVVKGSKLKLKTGIMPLLEIESGTNDPMAVFLTTALTGLLMKPETSVLGLIPSFLIQMAVGAVFGIVMGRFGEWIINRTKLDNAGLYSAATIGVALVAFAGAEELHGNPFLAVYLAGMTLGNSKFLHKQTLIEFHDGLAWLMQIVMFIVLGLLVFPSRLWPLADEGLILSFLLVFIARPIAVLVSLSFTKWLSFKEKLFVSWVGLRGAVPIILATIPLTAGVPQSDTMFDIVFFAVLTSVLLQGTLIKKAAKYLGAVHA